MNNKITIYELFGKIKDGQAPERILYDSYIWIWTGDDYCTKIEDKKEQFLMTGMYYTWLTEFLNSKVEILDNEDEEKIKVPTEEEAEILGYKVAKIVKAFQKGVNIALEEIGNEDEEKKIPEKLYKYMEKEEKGCFENILRVYDGGEYEINEDMSFVIDKINSVIDYLKSKGE